MKRNILIIYFIQSFIDLFLFKIILLYNAMSSFNLLALKQLENLTLTKLKPSRKSRMQNHCERKCIFN